MKRIPIYLLAIALLGACAAKPVKLYPGNRLPANEVALLSADRGGSSGLTEIIVRRINGVDAAREDAPAVEILPGKQIVRIELFKKASDNDMESRHFVVVTFNAEAGHAYRAQGKIDSGLPSAWIVDDKNNKISSATE